MDEVLQKPSGVRVKKGNNIDVLKVLLTVGIVLRHATFTDVPSITPAFEGIMKWIVIITEVCVPLFFVISGYLFFRNVPADLGSSWFWGKLRSRFFTLLIPYLIANLIAFGVYYAAGRWFPSLVSGYFGENLKDPIFVFWKGPVNLSLWFIRELIVVTILSPIIFLVVKYFRWWGVLAAGVLWAIKVGPAPFFFFSAGACLAVWKIKPVEKWLLSSNRVSVESRAWTYFIYLFHYLLVIGLKKGFCALISPTSTIQFVGIYIASALGSLAILTVVYIILRRLMPRVTSVLVGGK